jgi:hypothetical protein
VALLEKRRFLYNHSGDFPQVILIVPSHVPNKFFMVDPGIGMEKIRIRSLGRKKVISGIRDKRPSSATLPRSIKKVCKDMQDN